MIQLSKKTQALLLLWIVLATAIMPTVGVPADTETKYGNKLKTYISYSRAYGGKAKVSANPANLKNLKLGIDGIGWSLSLPIYRVVTIEATIQYKANGRTYTVHRYWSGYSTSTKTLTKTLPPGTTDVWIDAYAKFEYCSPVSLAAYIFLPRIVKMTIFDSA